MNIPKIRIQTTPAVTEMNTRQGQLSIEQPSGELQIEQPKADMNISRVPGKLTIDQTQAREDVDLKSLKRRMEDAAQQGRQDMLNGIARRIQEGAELMKIENGFKAIQTIAKRKTDGTQKEFGLGFIPRAGSVKITYDPGSVDVQITANKPKVNYTMKKPVIDFQPGKVQIDMKQYPSVDINFES
ncbi:DUF6470 family protein [Robertmurraya sp. P23]|uniref:DUF6470 family protein n=1 Tax=Robertmurraya sp. P23 TaxID=3436931 RepID=UPI003D97A9DD